jgi:hypothetical protein
VERLKAQKIKRWQKETRKKQTYKRPKRRQQRIRNSCSTSPHVIQVTIHDHGKIKENEFT